MDNNFSDLLNLCLPVSFFPLNHRIPGAFSAFRAGPGDILVRVLDITGFAVKAVGRVELQSPFTAFFIGFDFIDIARSKSCAGAAVGFIAAGHTQLCVMHDQMGWLILTVHGFKIIFQRHPINQASSTADILRAEMDKFGDAFFGQGVSEITHCIHFGFDPALFEQVPVRIQAVAAEIFFFQGRYQRLGGQHARFHGHMDAFKSGGVVYGCGAAGEPRQ